MILKLNGLICTRWHVEQIAKEHTDVTEIDFSGADIVGASTMHQFMGSFPDAKMIGLDGFNKTLYEMVLDVTNSDEFKHNQSTGSIRMPNRDA